MTTRQLLSVTLLATTLTLNAATPIEIRVTTKQQSASVSTAVANILFRRGIEKKKAFELAKRVTTEDEDLFALMLHSYLKSTSLHQEDVLEVLAKFALNATEVDLSAYSFLIKLTQAVQGTALNPELFASLEQVSTNNTLLKKIIT